MTGDTAPAKSKQKIEISDICSVNLNNIEGPMTDPFTGKQFYVGVTPDGQFRVKFTMKYIEMGKVRIAEEKP